MNAPLNADSWLDLIAYLIMALSMIGVAAIPVWLQRRKVNEIHDQAVNSHKDKDNLRDQIDRIESIMIEGFQSVDRRLDRFEGRLEREIDERIAADKQLRKGA
ncbi:hypothetical protein PBI_GAIA_36 [Mycobacterium phage Gaia]|uniref:Minor tail protein n=1 Tax=Mycobacterium phage Gaia TaxID=1486472 RepID=A0A068F4I8_9CAUD|nr:hypothetical protein VC46_gp036 [Mycobacterium phage Gaia]AID58856.1 hypothetical protein PBI_GAIA_36 [Mycobacterium phage Gaia]AYQ99978.1 hypothetical protein PBI_NEBKISS_37 [Mycobacterium phage Nebkiss]